MKSAKPNETKIIIVVSAVEQPAPSNQPKVNPAILKAISLVLITTVSWLNPEATIAISLIRLLFLLLAWLNQKKV
ncbi:MAG: hypothetical protein AAF652_05180 [Cyanobacteria bacterium P01_C01_bin.72]